MIHSVFFFLYLDFELLVRNSDAHLLKINVLFLSGPKFEKKKQPKDVEEPNLTCQQVSYKKVDLGPNNTDLS